MADLTSEERAREIVDAWRRDDNAHGWNDGEAYVYAGLTDAITNAIQAAVREEREACAGIVNAARVEGADLRELVSRIRSREGDHAR